MTVEFSPAEIDPKWRARWAEQDLYRTPEPSDRPTFYCLDFFPYPSGDGISVGHLRNYVPTDVLSRVMRMRGYDVLHPMGWDAFGLPTENAAIETGRHPADLTREWSANYKRQLDLAGASFDWAREINSTHPEYYRWTQWMFLKLFERGLAYRATGLQWWCPICGALANEEVNADGTDWRGHTDISQRELTQWFFKITDYADQLIEDLEGLDWPEETCSAQVNWIGRSEGADVVFATEAGDEMPVFTTRPDTLFGATFMVLAPEHPLVDRVTTPEHADEVKAYVAAAARKAELERVALDDDKTGVFTGGYAINPVNGERLPIWIADYVLMSYGSGAIMAVPAHDQRDFDFATRYDIEIRTVIAPPDWAGEPLTEAFLGEGPMVNSDRFDGLPSGEGIRAVTEWLRDQGAGDFAINYKLRDWLISRQRYWGTPIPIVHCDDCGEVPVPEDELPVLLPHLDQIDPQQLGGRAPLDAAEDWVNTPCPACGKPGRRETDTLGGFACSSWYFLRFCSPDQQDQAFDLDAIRRWMPVDLYVGGAEHSVMHLLYARFWTKALRDAGVLDLTEPFKALRHQGILLAQGGWVDEAALRIDSQGGARVGAADGADAYEHPESAQPFRRFPLEARFELTGERAQRNGQALVEFRVTRMSKSWRNVVSPDEVAATAGGDALRCYILFIGPFDRTLPWSDLGRVGVSRWLGRVWNVVLDQPVGDTERRRAAFDDVEVELRRRLHQTIRRVSQDIDALKFNTMIAALMEFTNFLVEVGDEDLRARPIWTETIETFLVLLAPSAVFMAEELWERTGHSESIHRQPWPEWDPELAADETFTLVVQVNGKVRDRIEAPVTIDEAGARDLALASERAQAHLNGRQVRKVFYREGRLINLVVG
ncbi:MAG: leucine--tRNA ligase [Chloroflexi bacterium]|nr:leucine--tRNA ligase [Chloroflexota bacterium]